MISTNRNTIPITTWKLNNNKVEDNMYPVLFVDHVLWEHSPISPTPPGLARRRASYRPWQ